MLSARAVVLVCVLAPVWSAAAANAQLEEGKAAFQRGEFAFAKLRFDQTEKAATLTEDELVELYWYRAAVHHALGNEPEETREHALLLRLRPMYTPDVLDTAPDLRAEFQKRQAEHHARNPVVFWEPVIERASIVITVEGKTTAARLVLFARAQGQPAFKRFEAPLEAGLATVPLSDAELWRTASEAGTLELVVEAQNPAGIAQSGSGTAANPLLLAVSSAQAEGARQALNGPVAVAAPVVAPPRPNPPEAAGRPPLMLIAAGSLLALGGASGILALATLVGGLVSGGVASLTFSLLTATGSDKRADRPTVLLTYRLALIGGGVLALAAVLGGTMATLASGAAALVGARSVE